MSKSEKSKAEREEQQKQLCCFCCQPQCQRNCGNIDYKPMFSNDLIRSWYCSGFMMKMGKN